MDLTIPGPLERSPDTGVNNAEEPSQIKPSALIIMLRKRLIIDLSWSSSTAAQATGILPGIYNSGIPPFRIVSNAFPDGVRGSTP